MMYVIHSSVMVTIDDPDCYDNRSLPIDSMTTMCLLLVWVIFVVVFCCFFVAF